MQRRHTALAATLLCVASVYSQGTPTLHKDINLSFRGDDSTPYAMRALPGNTVVPGFVRCGDDWYFTADAPATGRELYRTDGTTAGTVLVKDIAPGEDSGSPTNLVCCGSTLFFSATDKTHGQELWKSDGTAAGTMLVKDIFPGTGHSGAMALECLGSDVYFSAFTTAVGWELWKSDGTAAGTMLVKDIRSGSANSFPRYLRAWNGKVFFQADDGTTGDELWMSDGTAAGTVLLRDIYPGGRSGSPNYLQPISATKMLFVASESTTGTELWETDGTTTGTKLLKDLFTGSVSSSPDLRYPAQIGDTLFFTARGDSSTFTGAELFKTDGTADGTVLVKDIATGPTSGLSVRWFTGIVGTTLFFAASQSDTGTELWRSDGTAAGTTLVKDIYEGARDSSSPRLGVALGNSLLFSAHNIQTGRELWVSDGTAAGTQLVTNAVVGSAGSEPEELTAISATRAIYAGATTAAGREIIATGGTEPTTQLVLDINTPGRTESSFPQYLACSLDNEHFFFSAYRAETGNEPYVGTAKGCDSLGDLNPGTSGSSPSQFTSCWNGKSMFTVFAANTTAAGRELFITDGTSAGTKLLVDIQPGNQGSSPSSLVCCGGKVYFVADDGTHGFECWVTDGTASGTKMLADITPGATSSFPSNLTCCKGKLYFTASDSTASTGTGSELYVSDGTPAGTRLIKDIRPGTDSSSPSNLRALNGSLVFNANDGTNGSELWASDGTAAGTQLLKDIHAGSGSSNPTNLTVVRGKIYFGASDGSTGNEPWITDGTAAGTIALGDLRTGGGSSSPAWFTECGDLVFFRATGTIGTNSTGIELHVTDGTPAGTKLVKDIYPGSLTSFPKNFVCCRGTLYFAASTGTSTNGTGTELWKSDGTEAGTVLVKDIEPGRLSSEPRSLMAVGSGFYFSADGRALGRELWYSDGTEAGTNVVADLNPRSADANPDHFMICCGQLYFSADAQPTVGLELFRIAKPGATAVKLGTGGPGAYSELCATDPILGGTSVHTYRDGPASHIGVFVYSRPYGPALPFNDAGILVPGTGLFVDPMKFGLLAVTTTSSGSFPLPMPGGSGFDGLKMHTQILWVPASGPILGNVQATNGVALSVGK